MDANRTYILDKISPQLDKNERIAICRIIAPMYRASEQEFQFVNAYNERISIPEVQFFERLNSFEPLDYILGYKDFFDFKLTVDQRVLIPRSETEELVWYLRQEISKMPKKNLHILDIGTGSSCIALALKRFFPHLHITAIDISKEALTLARANAKRLRLEIDFQLLDFLDESQWAKLPLDPDIIVSNPPYIPYEEKAMMDISVLEYEPAMALFVDDPFIFYKKILLFAQKQPHLPRIYLECNSQNAMELQQVYQEVYQHTALLDDLQGLPRIICAGDFKIAI